MGQRIIIKFLAREGVNLIEILKRLVARIGETTLSKTGLFVWHKEFSEVREVENLSHDRCPRTSSTAENIEAIRMLIEQNQRIVLFEIVEKVNIS